jgi:hypothetical protein
LGGDFRHYLIDNPLREILRMRYVMFRNIGIPR